MGELETIAWRLHRLREAAESAAPGRIISVAMLDVLDQNGYHIQFDPSTPEGERLAAIAAAGTVNMTAPTIPDIKAEAQRRIIDLVGASDLTGCLVKQLNAQMRASELINKRVLGQTLTESEEAEAAALQALAAAIKTIRARSDALELTLPADYTSNAHWA